MELMRRASEQRPGNDGMRRTRCVVVRNTFSQLTSTFLVSWMQFLWPISRWRVSKKTIEVRLNDIHLDVILMPLDSELNINRLLSLELTFAITAEFRELSVEIVRNVYSRCGRFPSEGNGGCTWYGLWGESNSFTEDSGWFPYLELNKPKNVQYFIQPGAFDPTADWKHHLTPNYYENFIDNSPEDWVNQYVHNQIGPSLSGQAVFKNTFNNNVHATSNLQPNPHGILCVGLDTARHPAAVVTQIDPRGRLLILAEIHADNMGIERFAYQKLIPLLQQPQLATIPAYLVVDPASNKRSEIGEESVIQALKRIGFPTVPARTNSIDPRLRAVDKRLSTLIDGKPAFLIDKNQCPLTTKALQSQYRYKKRKDGELEPVPEKSHPWSDYADAIQYACLGSHSSVQARAIQFLKQKTIKYHTPQSAAWT